VVDKPELIRTMQDAYQRFAQQIEHLPDERLLEPATNEWTGKEPVGRSKSMLSSLFGLEALAHRDIARHRCPERG
jgi:hypothetical protein